jgi:hypothetical protein
MPSSSLLEIETLNFPSEDLVVSYFRACRGYGLYRQKVTLIKESHEHIDLLTLINDPL